MKFFQSFFKPKPQPAPYECELLDRELLHAVPARFLEERLPNRSELVLNPELTLQLGLPRPRCEGSLFPPEKEFPTGRPFAWVPDSSTAMCWPYSLDESSEELVKGLANGARPIRDLDEGQIQSLLLAGVLVRVGAEARRPSREARLSEAKASLRAREFAVLRDLLPPLQIAAVRIFFRQLEAQGHMLVDPNQAVCRLVYHKHPIGSFIHRQSSMLIREITEEAIFPSYSLVSAYRSGAILAKHVDRPQCRWNASVLLDMNPEVPRNESWPIFVESLGRPQEVRLEMGECLLYRGDTNPHWRDRLDPGRRQTLLLLHYVPIDFQGGLD